MGTTTFSATLELHGKSATGIEVPATVVEGLGGGRRPPVRITVSGPGGEHSYRTTVASMGGRFLVPVSAENRSAAGLSAGDEVRVTLELDTEPRVVEMPEDLAAAVADDPGARAFFDSLAPTHQKECVRSITEAKRPETRARRVAQAAEMLRARTARAGR